MDHGFGIWYILRGNSIPENEHLTSKCSDFTVRRMAHTHEKLIFLFVYRIVIGYIWYKIVIITVYNVKPTF